VAEKLSQPSERIRKIYFAVGLAITQWQQIELGLTQLFIVLLNAKTGTAASTAFSAAGLNFRTKLAMVDAASFVMLRDTPLFVEWNAIRDRLEKKARNRNQIAHFMLYQKAVVWNSGEREPTIEELNSQLDWYLRPTALDGASRRKYPDGPPTLTTHDIMNRANAFIKAGNELWTFGEKVRAHLAQPTESHGQA
jgi:hypothetical protein